MIEKPYLANPLLGNNLFVPDVEAHVFEGRLYFYGTYGSSFGKKKEFSQVHVFSTEDFLTYEDHGEAFSIHDIHWAQDTQIWAPDCVYRDGKYYLYYCLPVEEKGACGVAVSDRPYGPFTDLGKIRGVRGIDPAVLLDDDGQAYLYYGQRDDISVAKLKPNMCEIEEDSIVHPMTRAEHGYHEGISVRKIGGKYYLIYTDESRHGRMPTAQGYAVSDRPTEGFVYKNIIIDNFGCDAHTWNNHGSIEQYKGQWYIFYHKAIADSNTIRQLWAEPIAFDAEGNIAEVEMTSSGVGGTILATQTIPACLACFVSGHARIDYEPTSPHELALCEVKGQDTATYRYIAFDGECGFELTLHSKEECRAELYVDGKYHESVRVKPSETWVAVKQTMPPLYGTHSITLKFFGIDTYRRRSPLTGATVDSIRFYK